MTQIRYFAEDIQRMLGRNKIRILHIWLSRTFAGVFLYRLERSLFLVFGKAYGYLRIPLIPIFNIIQAYSNIDIHYKSNIKGGISILHSSVGCVISGKAKIGRNLTVTGGNIIGINKKGGESDFIIGNNCSLGANATIVGPLILSDNIIIGASACVVKDCLIDGAILIGVPAQVTN